MQPLCLLLSNIVNGLQCLWTPAPHWWNGSLNLPTHHDPRITGCHSDLDLADIVISANWWSPQPHRVHWRVYHCFADKDAGAENPPAFLAWAPQIRSLLYIVPVALIPSFPRLRKLDLKINGLYLDSAAFDKYERNWWADMILLKSLLVFCVPERKQCCILVSTLEISWFHEKVMSLKSPDHWPSYIQSILV